MISVIRDEASLSCQLGSPAKVLIILLSHLVFDDSITDNHIVPTGGNVVVIVRSSIGLKAPF